MSFTEYGAGIIERADPELYAAIRGELDREENTLELIASENNVSEAILAAQGSVLTNKYAEGYPARRYYGGCEHVDIAERLAIERAKKLFGAEHVNAQPHSGSQANQAVYFTLLKPGDAMMGLNLAHGGHLTHGHPLNLSGKLFEIISYDVEEKSELIDFDKLAILAREKRPKLIVAGASAYPRAIEWEPFRKIADEVGAYFMVDMAHIAGLVAAGLHPSPIPIADFVTTTTHKTLRGPRGGMIFCKEKFAKDLDRTLFPGLQGGPLMHVIAAKAVALKEAMSAEFVEYQRRIIANARRLADRLSKSPDSKLRLVAGGTDTHLILADLRGYNITGAQAEKASDRAGITLNKNMIPFDPQTPMKTSGIRIGLASVATRKIPDAGIDKIGDWILKILADLNDESALDRIRGEVELFLRDYPIYESN